MENSCLTLPFLHFSRYQDTDGNETSSSESTDEIPVWVRGEQRWISGVTDHTTAADLVEALIQDEGISDRAKDYVITERWRRVEQILDGRTKILKIWSAWGEAQAEVIPENFAITIKKRKYWLKKSHKSVQSVQSIRLIPYSHFYYTKQTRITQFSYVFFPLPPWLENFFFTALHLLPLIT